MRCKRRRRTATPTTTTIRSGTLIRVAINRLTYQDLGMAPRPEWTQRLISKYRPSEEGLRHARSGLSRFRLVNQRVGFLRFAAGTDSRGVWHGGKVSGYGER